jgi:hypothetical protein
MVGRKCSATDVHPNLNYTSKLNLSLSMFLSFSLSVSLPSLSHFLIPTYRLWVLDKDLGAPHLVLVWFHIDCPKQVLDALAFVPTPPWPCLGGQNGIPGRQRGDI